MAKQSITQSTKQSNGKVMQVWPGIIVFMDNVWNKTNTIIAVKDFSTVLPIFPEITTHWEEYSLPRMEKNKLLTKLFSHFVLQDKEVKWGNTNG